MASNDDSTPEAPATPSREMVEAEVTPEARPAQRAMSTMGTIPPFFRSSRLRCSPEDSTTRPRRNPVGGRWERANSASSRSSRGRARAGRNVSAMRGSGASPHTARLSTSTDTRISALSWVGCSRKDWAEPRQDENDRTNRGSAALTLCWSGWNPHRCSTSVARVATEPR